MTQAPYGSWASPISAAQLATAGVALTGVRIDGDDLWWLETRPKEGGRSVVVHRPAGGQPRDLVPQGSNARTQVHEYGGGSWTVHGRTLYFANWDDQRLYRIEQGGDPVAITPEPPFPRALRYADMRVTPDGSILVCVRESHTRGEEATNEIVSIPTDGSSAPTVICSGSDFYASPRLSSDASRIAWIQWEHPNLPWDGTQGFVASFHGDSVTDATRFAGEIFESVVQPQWGPDDVLYYVSDRSGWWNIYTEDTTAVCATDAEFAGPHWTFDASTYAFVDGGDIVCSFARGARWRLGLIHDGSLTELGQTTSLQGQSLRSSGRKVAFVAAAPDAPASLRTLDLDSSEVEVVRLASEMKVDPGYISIGEPIDFESEGRTAHAYFYSPRNADFEGMPGEKPPLVVFIHGGPTGQTTNDFAASIQYWTSRGFALVDVNYGGSTGYGRDYRQLLNGNWGVVDVQDCVNAARFLADRGDVDPNRMAIRGGSAGGFTTLAALVWSDVFKAGANYFGVTEMETFVGDTHKFEARYLDSLIGPYPERKDLYFERSPANFVDKITAPVITLQGLEDAIVPPSQSEHVVEALRRNGVPCAYVTYEGEQHGWRKAETIEHSLGAELYFYGRVFGFDPAGDIAPVEIENL